MEDKKYTESSIKSLDWKEQVWLRPMMYFDKCFEENTLNCDAESSPNFTTISFEMSKEIFGNLQFEYGDLQLRLSSLRKKIPNLKMELYKL